MVVYYEVASWKGIAPIPGLRCVEFVFARSARPRGRVLHCISLPGSEFGILSGVSRLL